MVEDLGNQQHVQERIKAAKAQSGKRDDAFRWLMSDARGRLLMWELLARTGVFKGGLRDTASILFDEGARNVGLKYLADVQRLTPAQFITMQAEANAKPARKKPEGDDDGGSDASDDTDA
jgi:hypothetical protein